MTIFLFLNKKETRHLSWYNVYQCSSQPIKPTSRHEHIISLFRTTLYVRNKWSLFVCHICNLCLNFKLTSLMSTPAPVWKARSIIHVVLWPSHNWRWSWIISWKHSITEPLLADSTFAKPKYDFRAPTSHFLSSSSKAKIFLSDLPAWTGILVPGHTH